MKIPYTIKNYWISVGTSFLIATISNLMVGIIIGSDLARFIYIGLLAYWIIIEIRRFHDANKTGLLVLINLIPGIGTLAVLESGDFNHSESGENRQSESINKNQSPGLYLLN